MNRSVLKFLVHMAVGTAFSFVLSNIVKIELRTETMIDDYFDDKPKNDNPYLED